MFSSLLIINYLESVLLGEPWNTFSVVLNSVLIKRFVDRVCWFDWSQGYIVSLSSDDMKLQNKKPSACSGVLTLSVLPCPSHTHVPAHTVLRIKLRVLCLSGKCSTSEPFSPFHSSSKQEMFFNSRQGPSVFLVTLVQSNWRQHSIPQVGNLILKLVFCSSLLSSPFPLFSFYAHA